MAIEEVIDVSVSGLGSVDDLAAGLERAAKAAADVDAALGKGIGGGAAGGADKLAASYDAAFKSIQAGFDRLQAQMDALGKGAGGGADAAAASLSKIADAEKAAATQADAMAASVGKADGSLKGLGDTGDAAAASVGRLSDAQKGAAETAAGLRDAGAGVSDGLKVQADQTAALTAAQADMAGMQKALAAQSAEQATVMAASSAKVAEGQRGTATAYKDASAEARATQKAQSAAAAQAAADAEASSHKHQMAVLGVAAALGYGVDLAAKLQQGVTRLYTSAGESQANLPLISQGILGMSGPTATSQAQLLQGAYFVESAGIHGQSALNVLKAVAQGAVAEGAPLQDVANAATSIINAYGIKPTGTAATSVVNQMLAAVGQGKMTMAGLSSALPAVLAPAAVAGISLPQVLGSVASMTATGMSPDQATQDIRHAITSLQKPTNVQAAELQMLGISPVQLSHDLGQQGLTGTIAEVDSAIQKHIGKGGLVLLDTMNQSRLAVQSANEEIQAMPPAIQGVARAYLDGSISAKAFNKEIFSGSESARDKTLLQQFATTAGNAIGFSQIVKSGLGDRQTVTAALNAALGGQTGAQVAEMLGGAHLATTASNIDRVAQSAQHAGSNIRGWSDVQHTLNYQLRNFEYSLEAVATQAGQVLLPAVTTGLHGLSDITGFAASHKTLTQDVLIGGGLLALPSLLSKVTSPLMTGLSAVGKVAETLHIPGLDKLANLGPGSGLGGAAAKVGAGGEALSTAAGAVRAGGEALSEAAATLKGEGAAGAATAGEAAAAGAEGGAAAGGAAAEGEAAAGGAAASRVRSGAGTAALGVLATATVVDPWLKSMKNSHGNWLDNAFGTPSSSGWNSWSSFGHDLATLWGLLPPVHGAPPGGGGPAGSRVLSGRYMFPSGSSPAAQPGATHWTSVLGTQPASVHWTSVLGQPGQEGPPGGGVPASRFALPSPPPGWFFGHTPQPGASGGAAQPQALLGTGGHPSAVTVQVKPQVDKSAFNAALAQAMGAAPPGLKPVKLPPPDTSALKGSAASAASSFEGALQAAMGHPVKVPAPDLSALNAARGPAAAAGASAGQGFASGISSEAGAVSAAAAHLASIAAAAMHAALQSHSPSKVTEKIGQDFDAGFTQGIAGNATSVKAASAQIGSQSVASLLQGLAGGQSNVQNAIQAVMGAASNPGAVSTIQQTIATLIGDVPSKDTALVRYLQQQQGKLASLANKQGAIEQQISNAQQLATSVISGAGITSAYGYTPALAATGGAYASQSLITGMQQQLADTKAFAGALGQDKKLGLNATTLSQLAQAGTAAGLPLAEGLAQGGKAAIQQMNAIQAQIGKEAKQIGSIGGTAMYQAGQQVTQGLDAGLKKELEQLDKEMSKIANSIIATVEHKLGGKSSHAPGSLSPAASASSAASAVAGAAGGAGVGRLGTAAGSAATGLDRVGPAAGSAASGLDRVGPAATAAANALGRLLSGQSGGSSSPGRMQPMGGGGYSGGGSAPQVVHVTHVHNWNIQGSLIHQDDLFDHVQEATLRIGSGSWTTGLIFAGRHP